MSLVKASDRNYWLGREMKRVKIFVHQPSINKLIGRELNLLLDEDANIIDAINEVDNVIKSKGNFPVYTMVAFCTWFTILLRRGSMNRWQ